MPSYYHAKDLGVSVDGAVCGAQSFSVSVGPPVTPIYQLGDMTLCGVLKAPSRGTASLTVLGDQAVVSGEWATIIADNTLTVACPLFGITEAACTGITFTGRAGSTPSATYTFTGIAYTTGGGLDPGACGCGVATEDISGPQAAYSITASCTVSYLEEFGNADLLAVVASQPRVTATMEYYVGSGAAIAVAIGSMTVTLDETLQTTQGGRGTVGGFGTYSISYFAGKDGSATGGLTIA